MGEIPIAITPRRSSLLALGFRPFFLAAGVSAALLMGVWLAMLAGWIPVNRYYGANWHAHEMLFGYTACVVAGFLLTAVRNWTGMATLTGPALGGLALLWVAGRVVPFLPVPGVLIASIDLSFLPLLAGSLIRPLWRSANRTNRIFLLLIGGMWLASVLVHLQALGLAAATATTGNRLMLDILLITLLLVAGRIMPFFTERGIPEARPVTRPMIERLTFMLAPLGAAANLVLPWSSASGVIALAVGCVQAVRLAGWHDHRVWRIPMLAILYAGYLWLIAGFLLHGLASLGLLPPLFALHALTTGAIGLFTLGMMTRVTLGHTGREIRATLVTNLAFILLILSAFSRVLAPLLMPSAYTAWIRVSAVGWALAFILFLLVYGPMLITPRIDGRPG